MDADHLLVTSAEMVAIEEQLFASGLPVEALMEKAALAVSRRLLPAAGTRPDGELLVLVGPGHNGGDGLVVAREWHLAGGVVRIWSPFERRRPLTEAHLNHARWLGLPVLSEPPDPDDPALWVDALFGIGQRRAPGTAIETLLLERQRQRPGALVAIDMPTGLCSDSGRLLGASAATAAVTYAIGLLKRGLVQDPALRWVGRLERIDLGLPASLLRSLPAGLPLALAPDDGPGAPWPVLDPAAGKYQRGRLLVLAGSCRYRGAAHLALAGASASGCGSLRAALAHKIAGDLWLIHPHVVLASSLGSTAAGGLSLADLPDGWLERLDAVLVGPGLGERSGAGDPGPATIDTGERRRWDQLQRFPGLVVLDADGLNRLASPGFLGGDASGNQASDWLQGRQGPTWITPHGEEFRRLFGDLGALSPLEAAAAAARRSGATVLLKGARSVVASPDGRRWQLLSACPEAARAGLGDVLAGYAAGRGAMALAAAAAGEGRPALDSALLAAAALDHAQAGEWAHRQGAGGTTPLAVAETLNTMGSSYWQRRQ